MIQIITSIMSCMVSAFLAYCLWKHEKKTEAFYALEAQRLELIDATTALSLLTGERLHEEGLLNGQLEKATERIRKAKAEYAKSRNEVLSH